MYLRRNKNLTFRNEKINHQLTGYQREYLLITICQLRYVIMRTEAIPCAFHYKLEMALCFLSIYVFGLNLNWVTYAKMKGSE